MEVLLPIPWARLYPENTGLFSRSNKQMVKILCLPKKIILIFTLKQKVTRSIAYLLFSNIYPLSLLHCMSACALLIFYLSYQKVNAFCQLLIKTLTKNKNGKNIAFNMKICISVEMVVDFHSI